jgi:hypothetical protein
MPTKSQLFKIWESQREFGVDGRGPEHDDITDREKPPSSSNPFNTEFTGIDTGLDMVGDGKGGIKLVPRKPAAPTPPQ